MDISFVTEAKLCHGKEIIVLFFVSAWEIELTLPGISHTLW